jgi:hypothetical protein
MTNSERGHSVQGVRVNFSGNKCKNEVGNAGSQVSFIPELQLNGGGGNVRADIECSED